MTEETAKRLAAAMERLAAALERVNVPVSPYQPINPAYPQPYQPWPGYTLPVTICSGAGPHTI